jgi:hypothetical protein
MAPQSTFLVGLRSFLNNNIFLASRGYVQYEQTNTIYGKVDTKGWTGMSRINSIESHFNGGDDPSNKALRRSNKMTRPTSANPHHMRSVVKGAKLTPNQTYADNLRFEGASKYGVGRPQSSGNIGNATL